MRIICGTELLPIVLLLTLLVPGIGHAAFEPRLSEIMAINESVLADENGDYSDWIEISNTGSTSGNLENWFLTDDPENLTRWTFPATELAPGDYLIVFASDKNRAQSGSELHTNFKLKGGGEYLALVAPDGMSVSSAFTPSFPPQFTDVSYGWGPGDTMPGFFTNPTPGNANGVSGSTPVGSVEFSESSRVFTSSLIITLSSGTPGSTIYYTSDGTDPEGGNGTVYTAALNISSSTEIRARAQAPNNQSGPVTRRDYVKLAADAQAFSSPLPIVVLDNFGAGSVPQRNSSTGPNGNDGSGVIQVPRQPVLMAIFDRNSSGQASPNDAPAIVSFAGIRVRGSSSSGLSKKPFSLESWKDGAIEESTDIAPFGLPDESDWVLYAPTETFSSNRYDRPLLHNSFIYQLSNEIGRYAARTQFVEVFLNTGGGELSMADYAGLYIFMEKPKRGGDRIDFEELSQDGASGGWMINVDRMDPVPIGGFGTPRHFHTPGPNQVLQTANDSPFGVRNIDDRPEFYHSFFNFVSPDGYSINPEQRSAIESMMNEFEDALYGPNWTDPDLGYAAWIDVDNFIDHFILHNLTKNQDAFVLSTWLYRAGPSDKLKFGPIWDFDRGYTTSPTNTNPASNLLWAANRMWYPRLFADIDFGQKYLDRWQELRRGAFATAHLHAIIEAQKTEITETVALRNGTSNWPAKVTAMKDWLGSRAAAIDAQFVAAPSFSSNGGAVPENFELTMTGAVGTTVYYTSDGSDPRLPGGGIAPNAIPFDGGPVDSDILTFDADCQFLIPPDDTLGLTWTANPDNFDDSTWSTGTPGIGWENLPTGTLAPAVITDISSQMRGINASAYFRWAFDFENTENINTLTLRVIIDDGFAAYLNGVKIGDFNAPAPILWNSPATGSRNDSAVLSTPIVIDASAFKSAVRNGSNTLAIHGMNQQLGGSDFLIQAALEVNQTVVATPVVLEESSLITARAFDGSDWSGPRQATFIVGTAPADHSNLVVSEIMYNPSPPSPLEIAEGILDGDQFEYIELMNISPTAMDLSGTAFTDGIGFTFPTGTRSVLPSGERKLVVKNLDAFLLRYGAGSADRIAGVFENDGNLRDSGERITLTGLDGTVIRDFIYDDRAPWPEAADGNGYSLVLELPDSNPNHSLPRSWRSSAFENGSPGFGDTQEFTGSPDTDNDCDGLSRLLEFALGTSDEDPRSGLSTMRSGIGEVVVSGESEHYFIFEFQKDLTAGGIRYRVERSSDLLTWQESPILIDETNLGNGTAILRFRTDTPLSVEERSYLRLRVDLE